MYTLGLQSHLLRRWDWESYLLRRYDWSPRDTYLLKQIMKWTTLPAWHKENRIPGQDIHFHRPWPHQALAGGEPWLRGGRGGGGRIDGGFICS